MSNPLLPSDLTPDPLSPAEQRARRVRQTATIRQGQQSGKLPSPAPAPLPRGTAAATKRFELHEVVRIPVQVSPDAREVIDASSSQGRLFPQALSEAFALYGNVTRVTVDVCAKGEHFPLHPSERDPVSGDEPRLLVIHAYHADGSIDPHRWFLNILDLIELDPITHHVRFDARLCAEELLRLYPHKHIPAPAMIISGPTPESEPTPAPSVKPPRRRTPRAAKPRKPKEE